MADRIEQLVNAEVRHVLNRLTIEEYDFDTLADCAKTLLQAANRKAPEGYTLSIRAADSRVGEDL